MATNVELCCARDISKTSHVILNLISIFLRVNLNSASVQKAAAHLRTHVVENTEQASLLRTGRDVAEIIRSLDFTVPEACGELERHLKHSVER